MNECALCIVSETFMSLINQYIENLAVALSPFMNILLISIGCVWIVFVGIKMVLHIVDFKEFGIELLCLVMAAGILSSFGTSGLANAAFNASTSIIGAGASIALISTGIDVAEPSGMDGMTSLFQVTQDGLFRIFYLVDAIIDQADWGNWVTTVIIAVFFIGLPSMILLVLFFANVVISIFRVALVVSFLPLFIFGFAFKWSRGFFHAGIRTLIASFLVLFGSAVALGLILHMVKVLAIGDDSQGSNLESMLAITNPLLWITAVTCWIGTALILESNAMANSIAGSYLSTSGAATFTAGSITAGAMGAYSLFKGIMGGGDDDKNGGGGSRPDQPSEGFRRVMDRVNTPRFDRNGTIGE